MYLQLSDTSAFTGTTYVRSSQCVVDAAPTCIQRFVSWSISYSSKTMSTVVQSSRKRIPTNVYLVNSRISRWSSLQAIRQANQYVINPNTQSFCDMAHRIVRLVSLPRDNFGLWNRFISRSTLRMGNIRLDIRSSSHQEVQNQDAGSLEICCTLSAPAPWLKYKIPLIAQVLILSSPFDCNSPTGNGCAAGSW